jgi:hypothetical protein
MLCIDDLEERRPPMHGANIAFAVIEQKYKANLSALGIISLWGVQQPKLRQERDLVIVDAILDYSTIAYLPNVAERKLNAPASGWKRSSRSYHRPSICAKEYTFDNHYVSALDELAHVPV